MVIEIDNNKEKNETPCNSPKVIKVATLVRVTPIGGSEPPKGKPWVDVIQGNRDIKRGMVVEFIAPSTINGEAEVRIEESGVEHEMHLWENTLNMNISMIISKIASVIGNLITTDKCTAQKLRISYARMLVEVDITQKMK